MWRMTWSCHFRENCVWCQPWAVAPEYKGADHGTADPSPRTKACRKMTPRLYRKTPGPPRISNLIQQSFNPCKVFFLPVMTENLISELKFAFTVKLWLPHPHSFKIAASPIRGQTEFSEMILKSRFRLFSFLHSDLSTSVQFYYLFDMKNSICLCISFL